MMKTGSFIPLAVLLASSLSSHAAPLCAARHDADFYHRYLSDVLLVESRQMLDPEHALTYGSDHNGTLLKSVLDPQRFRTALVSYRKGLAEGVEQENLSTLLRPLMRQYARAFVRFGLVYENEFLDTVQIGVTLLTDSAPSTETSTSAEAAPGNNDPDDLRALNLGIRQLFFHQLQNLIAGNKFSAAGARRALTMARWLLPEQSDSVSDEATPNAP